MVPGPFYLKQNGPFCPKGNNVNNNPNRIMWEQITVSVISRSHRATTKNHAVVHEIINHSIPTNTILLDPHL